MLSLSSNTEPLRDLLQALGDEIDIDEETFLLFSQSIPSQNLGIIDAKATNLDITIAGRDLSIKQSPGLLSSYRERGTTGAVLWKITPLFAEWMLSNDNILFKSHFLGQASQVLELGCGISGVVAIALAPRIGKYIATDQDYLFKLLRSNIEENVVKQSVSKAAKPYTAASRQDSIDIIALDWEMSSVANLSTLLGHADSESSGHVNAIIACDCIYNEELIDPFVRACAEISQQARASETPTICIIAQQLRSDSVFEAWLRAFHDLFHVWRIPDKLLIEGLKHDSGFVIHIGVLRQKGTEACSKDVASEGQSA